MTIHTVQIVDAARRGDACYKDLTGWYWHELDELYAINTLTIRGPFPSEEAARADAHREFEA